MVLCEQAAQWYYASKLLNAQPHAGKLLSCLTYLLPAGGNGTLLGTLAAIPPWLAQGEAGTEGTPAAHAHPTGSASSTGATQSIDCTSQTANKSPSESGSKPDSQVDLFLPVPGLPPILGHLVQAIKDRKFVDLGDLLPEALCETQFDRASDKKDDSKTKKKYTITTPLDWMVSFTTFMVVAMQFNAKRAFDLVMYASIVPCW